MALLNSAKKAPLDRGKSTTVTNKGDNNNNNDSKTTN